MAISLQLRIRIDARKDIASLALVGELDLATVPNLEDCLGHLEDEVAVIMLDLSELTFIDSAGLHALLQAKDRARSNQHRLILVRASQPTRRLLELTRTEFLLDDIEAVGVLDAFGRTEPRATGQRANPHATVAR